MAQYFTRNGQLHSDFNGMAIEHKYVDHHKKRVYLYTQDEGLYNDTLICARGSANIDNACVCNSSPNSAPFNPERDYMGKLFHPEKPHLFQEPTHAARCLMKERSPWSPKAPYDPYLGASCL